LIKPVILTAACPVDMFVCSGWREVFCARSWQEWTSEQIRRERRGGGWVDEEV